MKKFLLLAATLLIAGMANAKVVEKTYTVRGHCGMCKNRIETVAKGFEGVQAAAYDLKAQSLKLTYETRQVKQQGPQGHRRHRLRRRQVHRPAGGLRPPRGLLPLP